MRWVAVLAALAFASACTGKARRHRGGDRRGSGGSAGSAGSGGAGGSGGPVGAEPMVTDEALFIVATPAVTDAAVPGRFATPLPSTVKEVSNKQLPPLPYLRTALVANTAGMRDRVVAALTRAASGKPIEPGLVAWYGGVFGRRPDPALCEWLVAAATGKAPVAVRDVFWRGVAYCADPAIAQTLERAETPDSAVLAWYAERAGDLAAGGAGVPFSERAARVASAAARAGDDDAARKAGLAFAAMSGDKPVAALAALQLRDPKRRALVGMAMLSSKDPARHALGVAACQHPAVSNNPACQPSAASLIHSDPATTVAGMIGDGEKPAALLAKFPRADVVSQLAACAGAGDDYHRERCLVALAEIDRPSAVTLARDFDVPADPSAVAHIAHALVAFPAAGALDAELARLGFALDRHHDLPHPPLTADDLLFARGRTLHFDVETDQFPNQHDTALAELALLASPVLDGVLFDELAPASAMVRDPYELHAFADGKRYSVPAQNFGESYDLVAILGLLNALLLARHSELRFVALPTPDGTATVIIGPREGLRTLVRSRQLVLASAPK